MTPADTEAVAELREMSVLARAAAQLNDDALHSARDILAVLLSRLEAAGDGDIYFTGIDTQAVRACEQGATIRLVQGDIHERLKSLPFYTMN